MERSSCNSRTVHCLASKRVRAVSNGLQPLVVPLSGRKFRRGDGEREQEWISASGSHRFRRIHNRNERSG